MNSGSQLLEAIGKLFTDDVKIYARSMRTEEFHQHLDSAGLDSDWYEIPDNTEVVTINDLVFHGPKHRLFQYLLESGSIYELESEG